ncbi:MAG: DUF47 domain-containing protein [Elusimicrobia bacterium]|nr:DUF47 domain-containing protein [Elusimicrobiota bacterium]
MAFTLLPKEEKFFELLDAQTAHGVAAAKSFQELAGHWDPGSRLFDELRDIEHEADLTTHEVKDRLNRTFVTPFDREDIHALASALDDVVDIIQSTSNRMRLYKLKSCRPELGALAGILTQAAATVQKAVACLPDASRSRRLMDHCIEINRLENEGDLVLAGAIGAVFSSNADPLEVMKWDRIFEATEAAIDKCEGVAHILEGILVKGA